MEIETSDLSWQRQAGDANSGTVKALAGLIKKGEKDQLLGTLRRWHPADVVELFVALPFKRSRKLFKWLPRRTAAKVLAEISPDFRTALMADATVSRTAELFDSLDPEEAAEAISDLPEDVAQRVLPMLSARAEIEAQLKYLKDSAGAIMSRKFVAVPEDWTIEKVIGAVQDNAQRIKRLYAVFVIDGGSRPVGYLRMRDLLLLPSQAVARDVMRDDFVAVGAQVDQEEVASLAESYEMNVVPVVDADGRIVGRISADRLQQVVREEAEEDMKIIGGVALDARPDDSLFRLVRGRLPWLLTGLIGSSVAATVVGSFEDELVKAAIIASFIPVCMAMAGNAGIQAATVSVQGLASGTLKLGDLGWRMAREASGAVLNGALVSMVVAMLVVGAAQLVDIDAPIRLALAVGTSLVIVMVLAASVGSTTPLILDRIGIDPAHAIGVFITTSNDILGVLVFFIVVTHIYVG